MRHQCPVCNARAAVAECRPNLALDRIVTLSRDAAALAQKKYVESLFGAVAASPSSASSAPQPGGRALSALELLCAPLLSCPTSSSTLSVHRLQKHLSRCSRSFDDYLAQLQLSHAQRLSALRSAFESRALAVARDPTRTTALKAEFDEQARALRDDQDRAVALLTESYERYLDTLVPAPAKLPVLVTVVVPSKGLTFERVLLQPMDTPKELRHWLSERLAQRGDPVTAYAAANVFALYRSASDFAQRVAPVPLSDDAVPVALHSPEPGAVLALQGTLRCASDAPKRCFRHRYVKDAPVPQVVDYYTCRDCRMNWLCPECAQLCHVQRGHSVTEYMKAHVPTWGCCYCLKGGGCTLVEKPEH